MTHQAFSNMMAYVAESLSYNGIKDVVAPRLDLIPLGVDTDLFKCRDKQDIRYILGLPQNTTIVLHFGRIDHVTKGDINPLLLAFQRVVRNHGSSVVLVMAGMTSDTEVGIIKEVSAKLGCANQIIVRPMPSISEAPLYYSASDVFVSTSETLQECFGISPLEAMASGLPVVVSEWSGYRETVLTKRTGFHVKTYWARCDSEINAFAGFRDWHYDHVHLSQSVVVDPTDLFRYLDMLVSEPELRNSMGAEGRKHIETNYSWKVVISQYLSLWRELSLISNNLPNNRPLA